MSPRIKTGLKKLGLVIKCLLQKLARFVAIFAIWVGSVFVVFLFGPIVEGKFFPVIDNVRVTAVTPEKAFMRVVFEGDPMRNCRLIEITALTGELENLQHAAIFFEQKTYALPPSAVTQTYGPIAVYPVDERLILVAYHRCHIFWQTITPLANIQDSKS